MSNSDFLFRGELAELDPDVSELIRHETARQQRHLILIASESTVPAAVREALSSPFHNIYAEGYPLEETRRMSQGDILDYNNRLPEYRREADNRYYKGTEYANIVEALTRRRVAELFCTESYGADDLYVNVQPLSGAPANNAVYTALLNVGDTVMGMDLIQGGHLTHGSPVNRSGINYNIVSYGTDPATGQIDYDSVLALAREHRPRMIIAGYSSYPYAPDFEKFRAIADEVGAYLMADIAHVAGLVIGGQFPNPVGVADVVTFTTHKTLAGPRGAVIITHRPELSPKIDRAVFPGEQGGPHINTIAALAVALRLAATDQFKQLQAQIVENAQRLAQRFSEHGLKLAYGGTNTHLLSVDCSSVVGPDGTKLSGDMAARILDLTGIVLNRQTIPGDTSALRPSGIRIGTPWITQRGFGPVEIDKLADIIATVLKACVPFSYSGKVRAQPRAKIDFDTLTTARLAVRELAASVGIDVEAEADDYPHFSYVDQGAETDGWLTLAISGENAQAFLNTALTSNILALQPGEQQAAWLWGAHGPALTRTVAEATDDGYLLHIESNHRQVAAWLRGLSDGFVLFDASDPYAKVPGPVDVAVVGPADAAVSKVWDTSTGYAPKAYFIGLNNPDFDGPQLGTDKPGFDWQPTENPQPLTTPLYATHQARGAKLIDFAGYQLPAWYSSVREEHAAVRQSAGVFDVTHMGVLEISGPSATSFLDLVTTNDVHRLAIGTSEYSFLLDTAGQPLDDVVLYRLAEQQYLLVVNAANNDKVWAWLHAVRDGAVRINPSHPASQFEAPESTTLRDLRQPEAGAAQRVDIALQGPGSQQTLLALGTDEATQQAIKALDWAEVIPASVGGFDLIVSRTGYTGERTAYELFVHPEQAAALFDALVEHGATPCGLAARDSLRIEAGLPLYGHELAGPLSLNPADAGFNNYVRLYKPFFVGKHAYIDHEKSRKAQVTRFRLDNRNARPPHAGDPIIDDRGRVVGVVTSCSVDSEGYQLGQAYLDNSYLKSGTRVAIYAGATQAPQDKPLDTLTLGDKVTLPEPATIQRRFPPKS